MQRKNSDTDHQGLEPSRQLFATRVPFPAIGARALDGDTILVWDNSLDAHPHKKLTVRIHGIDAPELTPRPQPGAEAARAALHTLICGARLSIIPRRRWPDKYNRCIADVALHFEPGCGCSLNPPRNVATVMLALGLVVRYPPKRTTRQQPR